METLPEKQKIKNNIATFLMAPNFSKIYKKDSKNICKQGILIVHFCGVVWQLYCCANQLAIRRMQNSVIIEIETKFHRELLLSFCDLRLLKISV